MRFLFLVLKLTWSIMTKIYVRIMNCISHIEFISGGSERAYWIFLASIFLSLTLRFYECKKFQVRNVFHWDWKQAVFKFSGGIEKFRNLKGRKFQDSENLKFCLKSNSRLHKFRNRLNWNLWGVNFNNKLVHHTYLPA